MDFQNVKFYSKQRLKAKSGFPHSSQFRDILMVIKESIAHFQEYF